MKLKEKTMKLSDSTLTLLKNFSNINQSILFKKGRSLRTISVMKNILAEVTINEEIPQDFGIYDLNQFLNGLSLHQSPDLDFANDGYVVIKEGRSRSKYFFADPAVIITPPEKDITLPSEDVCFELSTQQLDKLLKAPLLSINCLICLLLVKQVLLNLWFVTRKMIPLTSSVKSLVKLILSSLSTSKLRTSRFSLELMKLLFRKNFSLDSPVVIMI